MSYNYRIKLSVDETYCLGCRCVEYLLQRKHKFLWLDCFTYWSLLDAYPEDMRDEAFSRLKGLQNGTSK